MYWVKTWRDRPLDHCLLIFITSKVFTRMFYTCRAILSYLKMGWKVFLILFLIRCKEGWGKSKEYNGNFQSLLYVYHYKEKYCNANFSCSLTIVDEYLHTVATNSYSQLDEAPKVSFSDMHRGRICLTPCGRSCMYPYRNLCTN